MRRREEAGGGRVEERYWWGVGGVVCGFGLGLGLWTRNHSGHEWFKLWVWRQRFKLYLAKIESTLELQSPVWRKKYPELPSSARVILDIISYR
jgi:hypothetical protein